ncbi:hypothetical protein CK203_033240 [Vitis vinifera]|uniref:Uncharacterized protein n=1 Tax=Vitis vinifera TaxID=29760 RepID=A0A438HBX6_VITVI|nr:hypothetical protein CK203_033240 [Vitis vinifera]
MKDFVVSLFPYTPEQARGTSFFLSVYDCHGGPQLLAKKGQGWWFSTEVVDQLTYLIWVLMRFEVILGLRVNLEKNKLMPVRRVENIRELAHKFGCKVGALPSTYLGLPLGVPSNSIAVWDGVDERQVISRKYEEEERGWHSHEVREAYRVGLWKVIKNEGDLLSYNVVFLLPPKRHGWRRFGIIHLRKDVGPLASLSKSTIRRWKPWNLVQGVGTSKAGRFPNKCDLKSVGVTEDGLICLGGYLEEGSNFKSHSEERVVLGE